MNGGMTLLSERRQYVLESLINEYVASAQPVGSKTLVARYFSDISSATVRNELSWLEDRGYVIAPHTSAGRIPTNSGYRSFVNHLLLKEERLLEVVMLGAVQQVMRGAALTTAQSVASMSLLDILDRIALQTESLAVFCNPGAKGNIIHRGLSQLLSQPEFAEMQNALPLIKLLEDEGELIGVLTDVQGAHGLHIRIGTENYDAQLFSFSMIATRIDAATMVGDLRHVTPMSGGQVIAVFGPTRMNYRRAIQALLQGAAQIGYLISSNDKRGHFEY